MQLDRCCPRYVRSPAIISDYEHAKSLATGLNFGLRAIGIAMNIIAIMWPARA